MLLDLVANGLISESATELLNGSFDEPEDPNDLPPAINQIVGKTFAFGIYVEKDHIVYGADIYKVGKVFTDRMEYHSNRTSGEETASHLTDCQDNTGIFSTTKKVWKPRIIFGDYEDDKMNFATTQKAYLTGKRDSEEHYRAILAMYKVQKIALEAKHAEEIEVCQIEAKLELVEDLIHLESLKFEKAKLEADLKVSQAKVDDFRVREIDWFKLDEPNMGG
ncbi:hypothetical protein Bca4012_063476 [Brassica carinata]